MQQGILNETFYNSLRETHFLNNEKIDEFVNNMILEKAEILKKCEKDSQFTYKTHAQTSETYTNIHTIKPYIKFPQTFDEYMNIFFDVRKQNIEKKIKNQRFTSYDSAYLFLSIIIHSHIMKNNNEKMYLEKILSGFDVMTPHRTTIFTNAEMFTTGYMRVDNDTLIFIARINKRNKEVISTISLRYEMFDSFISYMSEEEKIFFKDCFFIYNHLLNFSMPKYHGFSFAKLK